MTAKERYEFALKLMRQGSTTRAMEEFQRVRNYHRDDPVSVLAALAIADLHFQKGEYEQARYAYEEFAQYHPRHDHLDYVTWRIGLSIYKRAPKAAGRDQASTRSAVNAWTGFQARFPDSEWTDDVAKLLDECKERLASKELWIARFYQKRHAWRAVEGRASDMLRKYPDSGQADLAWYLLGTARHKVGSVDAAKAARERLAELAPTSSWLERLDRELAKAPGTPPEERVFLRPYRMPGMGAVPGQPSQ
jgi:outer membrane protein assembly factor BamD